MINNIAMPGCTIIPEANDYATSLSGQWTNYYTELFKATLANQQGAHLPTGSNPLAALPTPSNPLDATTTVNSLTNPLSTLPTSSTSLANTSNPLYSNSPSTAQMNALLASQQLQQQLLYQQYASAVDFYSSAARGHGIDMAEYFNKLQQYCQQSTTDTSLKRPHDSSTPSLAPEVKRRHFENALDLSVRN